MIRAHLALAISLTLVSAPSAAGAPSGGAGDPRDEMRAYLEACERFGLSGSVLVARRGKVVLAEGFGVADRERGVRNSKETCFEIASATKPFTAVAVLQLAEAGELDLDDSIAEHLPGVPDSARAITLRHLLMHTSGMPRSAAGGRGEDLERAVAGYLATGRVREPGAGHEYWNGGYALLAGVVERVSGGSYMDFCRAHIFEPVGMKSSGFTGDALFESLPVAVGYEAGAAPRRADEHPYRTYGWQYRGMGGLVTSVEDLYRFHQALRDDTLLSKESRETLLTPGDGGYSCGFYVLSEPRPVITHGGDVRGFHSKFSFYPDDDAAIVVLLNVSDVPTWTVTENLQALLFGDPSRYPAPPQAKPWSAKELESLAGTYSSSPEESVVVEVDGQALVVKALGIETTRSLYRPLLTPPGWAPQEPQPELIDLALEVLEGVADGDAEPLRGAMLPNIPKSWPDDVLSKYWPAHLRKWGALEGIRVAGALAVPGGTTVLLALEHELGESRVKVAFQGDRLGVLDLNGPDTLASIRLVPESKERLVGFSWLGEPPASVELLRDRKKRVRALLIPGDGGAREYERQE